MAIVTICFDSSVGLCSGTSTPVNIVIPKPYDFPPTISSYIGNRDFIVIPTSIVPHEPHVLIEQKVVTINLSFQDSYLMLVYFVVLSAIYATLSIDSNTGHSDIR